MTPPTPPRAARRSEILATHHVIDADLFTDSDEKLNAAARDASDEVMAATYLAGALEAQGTDVEAETVTRIALRQAMTALHTVEREAVELMAEQGMTLDEAAARLKVHVNTVQRRYKSGLRKLRAFLVDRGTKAR